MYDCGAVAQAERFRDAIQVVRDWLPEAEAELKFHSVPDDEESLLQLIDNHEVLSGPRAVARP